MSLDAVIIKRIWIYLKCVTGRRKEKKKKKLRKKQERILLHWAPGNIVADVFPSPFLFLPEFLFFFFAIPLRLHWSVCFPRHSDMQAVLHVGRGLQETQWEVMVFVCLFVCFCSPAASLRSSSYMLACKGLIRLESRHHKVAFTGNSCNCNLVPVRSPNRKF